jgi:nitrite reductase/ring-hydroxylating ferredoxin subunit
MTPQDAAALVQPRQLHRDIYLSPAVFALEMSRLWAGAWLFVGHDSQVPQPGDYTTMTLAGQPVMMIRREAGDAPGAIAVLLNRCAHKGAPLSTAPAGHADRYLRCPYHGWTYRLDGTLAGLPVKAGYEGSDFERCPAQRGLTPYGEVAVHRGFVFARPVPGRPVPRGCHGRVAGRAGPAGRPLAAGAAAGGRRRAAHRVPRQLEDLPREHQRRLPPQSLRTPRRRSRPARVGHGPRVRAGRCRWP